MKKFSKTFEDPVQGNGVRVEITNFSESKKKSPRIKIVCRDCNEAIEIHGSPKDEDEALEIGGVYASKQLWRKILLPLLDVETEEDSEYLICEDGTLKI